MTFVERKARPSVALRHGDVGGTRLQPATKRLVSLRGLFTTYFWYGGGWRRIISGTSTGPATLGLQLQADGDEFSHTDVRVAFDNFVVKATEADCPPGSDPR